MTDDTPAGRLTKRVEGTDRDGVCILLDNDITDLRAVFAENERLTNELECMEPDRDRQRDAVEMLHGLILRMLPNDGSEIPQPEDTWWAAQLDRVVTEAAAIYAIAIGSE